jgi:hypothetical protein
LGPHHYYQGKGGLVKHEPHKFLVDPVISSRSYQKKKKKKERKKKKKKTFDANFKVELTLPYIYMLQ